MANITGYELSRRWFDFCFANPEKITPTHTALYFFAVEHCNRLGWKRKFGLPTEMAKDALGIKSWHTYIKVFNDIVSFGFFELVEKSKNQYSSNIIALIKNDEALDEALDKATSKHMTKQLQSTYQSNDSIDKLLTINQELITNNIDLITQNLSKWIDSEKNAGLKRFTPPTVEDLIKYFAENGYTESSARKAYSFYSTANWHDSNGKKVKSWKQKMLTVWFKDENKITIAPEKKIKTDADFY
jgi:hypothetical protein